MNAGYKVVVDPAVGVIPLTSFVDFFGKICIIHFHTGEHVKYYITGVRSGEIIVSDGYRELYCAQYAISCVEFVGKWE